MVADPEADRLSDRQSPITRAIAAVGQRSLTCYLSQSVVWAVVFAPYLLDLTRTLTSTTTALLADATWLVRRDGGAGIWARWIFSGAVIPLKIPYQ